jgi:hypothetical protein
VPTVVPWPAGNDNGNDDDDDDAMAAPLPPPATVAAEGTWDAEAAGVPSTCFTGSEGQRTRWAEPMSGEQCTHANNAHTHTRQWKIYS